MNSNRGFTLIEILVAISIASLLLLGIYGVFGSLSSARNEIEISGAAYHQARVLFDRISRELRSLVPPEEGSSQTLQGGKDQLGRSYLELTSTAATPMGGAAGGVVVIRYLQADDQTPGGEKLALFRQERPRWQADDGQPGQRLLAAVATFDLRFSDGSQWLEQWDAVSQKLPAAVEISLSLGQEDEQVTFRTAFDLPLLVTP